MFSSVNLLKTLITLLENANTWLCKVENRLCNQDSLSSFVKLSLLINQLLNELEVSLILSQIKSFFLEINVIQEKQRIIFLKIFFKEVEQFLKQKQDEMNNIRDLTDRILTFRSKFNNDITNVKEILDITEEIKKRYKDIFVQISER